MSRFMPSAGLLAIGVGALALVGAKESVTAARVAEFEFGDATSLEGALRSLIKTSDVATMDVILADDVVKLYVVDPPAGLTRFSDLEAVASVRFEELFGFDATEWRISADWRARHRFMASAAPLWLLRTLEQSVRKIRRVEPAFVRSCNAFASREAPQWFVCRYLDWVAAAKFDGLACQLVRSGRLEADEPVMPWLEREALLAHQPLQRVLLMSNAGVDQDARVPAGDVVLIAPARHVQVLSALRVSAEVIA